MPLGLVRTGGYLKGFPVLEPLVFGTEVHLPHDFGNDIVEPHDFGNDVTWTPSPAHFRNPVPLYPTTYAAETPSPSSEDDILLEDDDSIELEDGSGNILLEN